MRKHVSRLGLTLDTHAPASVYRGRDGRTPSVEVNSVRLARRRGPREMLLTDLVVEVCQRRRGYVDADVQRAVDQGDRKPEKGDRDFRFRRGCTLIIDPVKQEIRHVIATKGNVSDNAELERVRRFLTTSAASAENPFYGRPVGGYPDQEDFATLHRGHRVVSDF